MLVVHHLGLSQSDRIVWLCEELGLAYELKRYERAATGAAPAEYQALSPFGTAPVITDGDLVLGESGAIIAYISDVHGGGRLQIRAGEPGFADYLFWFHFANGSLLPSVMMDMMANMMGEQGAGRRVRLNRAYDMIEDRLGVVPYLAGEDFTAADIMTLFPLTTMRAFAPRDLAPYPHIRDYLSRIGQRPEFARAMAKADPGFQVPLS